MTLRAQRSGKQKPWTREELSAGLKHFFDTNSRYPTATEVDTYPYLPSVRSIERRFGGLVQLRKQLGLKGQSDFRSGQHSRERARKINSRSHKIEQTVYDFLQDMFGKEFVHREYFFTDDRRTRADFFVYDSKKGFCVDVFYPSNRRNLIGCLNSKLKTYHTKHMRQYPVIFLQMNEDISQDTLDKMIRNKKNALATGQYLMAWGTLQEFCRSKGSLQVLR